MPIVDFDAVDDTDKQLTLGIEKSFIDDIMPNPKWYVANKTIGPINSWVAGPSGFFERNPNAAYRVKCLNVLLSVTPEYSDAGGKFKQAIFMGMDEQGNTGLISDIREPMYGSFSETSGCIREVAMETLRKANWTVAEESTDCKRVGFMHTDGPDNTVFVVYVTFVPLKNFLSKGTNLCTHSWFRVNGASFGSDDYLAQFRKEVPAQTIRLLEMMKELYPQEG